MIIRFRSASVITESSNHPHPNNDDLVLSGFLADAAGRKWVSARFLLSCFRGWSSRLFEAFRSCFYRFHIHFLSIPYAGDQSVSVCVCSPGDAGRHWSALVWMVSHRFLTPMFMSIYVNICQRHVDWCFFRTPHSQRIHVWNIYLHWDYFKLL